MKKAKGTKANVSRHHHYFIFKLETNDGKKRTIRSPALVRLAKERVDLPLEWESVARSMELHGVGNTQTCTMAVCSIKNADRFPHPVVGYMDWQYRRCYVASKLDKKTGLPSECYRYIHHDSIARLNDSTNGQKILLAELKKNGPRTIRLYPSPLRKPSGTGGKGGNTRKDSPNLRGAALRVAFAQLGGVPTK